MWRKETFFHQDQRHNHSCPPQQMTSLELSEVLTFSFVDRPNGAVEGRSPNCILNKVICSVFRFMASCSCFFRGARSHISFISVLLCGDQSVGCCRLSSSLAYFFLSSLSLTFSFPPSCYIFIASMISMI